MMSTSAQALSREELLAENRQLRSELARLRQESNAEIECLKAELAELKRLIFGSKRERFIPENDAQLGLALGEEPAGASAETEAISYSRRKAKQHTPHARQVLPAHLPRKEILIEPVEDVTGLKKIGEEITEELEYEPASLFVNRYVRPKYAKANGDGVLTGSLPSRPIEKGIAGPGLLAHILISKYVDHLPLYRQRKQLLRAQVDIPESTIDGWVKSCGELLDILYDAQRSRIILAAYLQVDETTLKVLDKKKKGKSHRGYFWVFHDPLKREVYFHYDPGRSGDVVREVLGDYHGFLQNDGFSGYHQYGKSETITLAGCMAHARRKFVDVTGAGRKQAAWMLKKMQRLYDIERHAREEGLPHRQRYDLRQEQALPVMDGMKAWLNEQYPQALPKSAIGKAISYCLNQWPKLQVYLQDGRLEIDNNLVENAIRPIALGRKNWLFAGSHDGARRAAVIYTLVANARLQGVEPFTYLRDILTRLPGYPHKQVAELLPANWQEQS